MSAASSSWSRPTTRAGSAAGTDEPGLAAARLRALSRSYGCSGCHGAALDRARARRSTASTAAPVHLQDGRTVVADEHYIRDSILLPQKDVVAGYEPVMPSLRRPDRARRRSRRSSPTSSRSATARRARPMTPAPTPSYLDDGYTLRSWLMTHRPQAHRDPLRDLDHRLLLRRRRRGDADPPRAGDARGRPRLRTTPTTSCSRCTA